MPNKSCWRLKMKIKITNPDKIVFPDDKITKLDIVNYYNDICEHMLKYTKNRPVSVIRCHKNIKSDCFFKKNVTTESDISSFDFEGQNLFCIKNIQDILNHAQLGTIEFHTWGCDLKKINCPTIMVFDLDPDVKMSIDKLRHGVLNLKKVLDDLNLQSFLKTSGGKGYHIIVPFKKSNNWKQFNNFAKQVARILESKYPSLYTTNIRKANRKNKIFVDYLRNSKGSTCVAPYSLRAKPTAPISFPVSWQNLDKILPNQINIKNYKKYLKTNPWQDFFDVKQYLV